MRLLSTVTLLSILLACDPEAGGPADDTIAAWEAWAETHTSATDQLRADARLQDLYLARAQASEAAADYDAYLERYPTGVHVDTVKEARQATMFRRALRSGTVADWETFLADYPSARGGHDEVAKDGLAAATWAPNMTMTPVRTAKVNLADDPEGPLNGTAFRTDITNTGDRPVQSWWLRIFYLDDAGEVLAWRKWPLVATAREFPVPMPEEASEPLAPGETRTWEWSTGDLPEGFSGEVALVPMRVRFADEG